RLRLADRVFPAAYHALHEARDRLRAALHERRRDHDGVGVEVHAVVAEHHDVEPRIGYPESAQREHGAEAEAGNRVGVATREHRLAQLRRYVGPAHLRRIETVQLGEHVEHAEAGVEIGRGRL